MSADCNHNTHYHRILLRFLPARGEAALDVGSGDGAFAPLLSRRYAEVVAIDAGPVQVAAVRARCGALPHVAVRQADLLDSGLPDGYFDAVTALAVLHHMPFADAAGEVKRLLKPRGRLVVLGVWTDHGADLALDVASTVLDRFLRLVRGPDAMTAPSSLQRTSWTGAQAAAAQYLPGARMRRRLLWRYTLVWDKPTVAW